MVLDHGAKPPLAQRRYRRMEADDRRARARDAHAVCKLSGLVTEAGSAESRGARDCVDHLLETFGPARLMWGSDWPVCELVCSYDEWPGQRDVAGDARRTEREQIYSGTARATYGI